MNNQTILITGGTGMVGKALTERLVNAGHQIIILTRKPNEAKAPAAWKGKVTYAGWDVKAQQIDDAAVAKANTIVHLAGAGVVDKPWTEAYKKEIKDSRVESSKLLVASVKRTAGKLKTFIGASAIGWYGADAHAGSAPFTEEAPAASGFLGETCQLWEESIQPFEDMNYRVARCRIGIVLSNEGGALPEFKKSLNFRVAGILASGKQMVSWIHIDDLCKVFQYIIEHEHIAGTFNATAPNPVDNKTLNIALAKAMYGNAFISMPVPSFVLKIMMGERSEEVLKSTTVSSQKIQQTGFTFQYPTIEAAMEELVRK